MKKVNIILFIFLIAVVLCSTVYFSVFYGKDKYDFTLYKKAFSQLMEVEEYDKLEDINIDAQKIKSENNESYLVSVTFDNARFVMQDIDVLVITDNPKDDLIYPSLGLIEDKSIDLVPSNPRDDNQQTGISLNISLKEDIENIYVYFSYILNDERITKYYEVKVNAATR